MAKLTLAEAVAMARESRRIRSSVPSIDDIAKRAGVTRQHLNRLVLQMDRTESDDSKPERPA